MAKRVTTVNPEEMNPEAATEPDMDLVSTAPADWEFETVVEESPTHVVFDTVGDVFIGQYVNRITITPETAGKDPFDLFTFRGRDGELYAVNPSGKLDSGMKAVNAGDWVRLTLVKLIPSTKGNPFKDFRVEVRRNATTPA